MPPRSPLEAIADFIDSTGPETATLLRSLAVIGFVGRSHIAERAPADLDRDFADMFVAAANSDRSLALYLYLRAFLDYHFWFAANANTTAEHANQHGGSRETAASASHDAHQDALIAKAPAWDALREGPLSFRAVQEHQTALLVRMFQPAPGSVPAAR